jgi:hypothetical protein
MEAVRGGMNKCVNGQKKYRTEKEAYKARASIFSNDPSADMLDLMLDLLPYTCPLCGYIHLGHRSKYLAYISRMTTARENG